MSTDTPKTRRWQRILLVASLALNLAIVGVVAGVTLGGGPKDRMQRFDLTVGPLTRAMDEDRRDAVRSALRDSGSFRPADRTNIRADFSTLLDTLRRDDFDESAFRDVLTRQQQRLQGGQAAVMDAVTDQIKDMSESERAAFADRLEENLRRGPRPRDTRSGG